MTNEDNNNPSNNNTKNSFFLQYIYNNQNPQTFVLDDCKFPFNKNNTMEFFDEQNDQLKSVTNNSFINYRNELGNSDIKNMIANNSASNKGIDHSNDNLLNNLCLINSSRLGESAYGKRLDGKTTSTINNIDGIFEKEIGLDQEGNNNNNEKINANTVTNSSDFSNESNFLINRKIR